MSFPQTFTLFSLLPKELRLEIWKLSFTSRIVYLQQLERYRDNDQHSPNQLYQLPHHQLRNPDPDPVPGNNQVFISSSGCFPPSPITFVCQEAFEAVSMSYEKLFADQTGYPQLWFNFDIDTLYLDWGWIGFGQYFDDSELPDEVVGRIKHLALFQREVDLERWVLDDDSIRSHEQWLCALLSQLFCNLETLTMVNRRHLAEDAEDLVFMDPIDSLLVWEYRDWESGECTSRSWDSAGVDEESLKTWLVEQEEIAQKELLPIIKRKIITDRKTMEKLVGIVGSVENLFFLQKLTVPWSRAERWPSSLIHIDPGMPTRSQQIDYAKMLIEARRRDGKDSNAMNLEKGVGLMGEKASQSEKVS